MSARQLKKLRKAQELLDLQEKVGGSSIKEESETEEEKAPAKASTKARPTFLAFAALANTGGDDGDDAEQEDESDGQQDDEPVKTQESAPISTPKSKKKRPKKKKKNKNAVADLEEKTPARGGRGVDDIDRAMRELNLAQPQAQTQVTVILSDRVDKLLSINFHHLKAMNEMRRVFGKNVMQSAESEANAPQEHPRHRQQQVGLEEFLRAPPGKGMSELLLRRNPFIDGKKTWPSDPPVGLTMKRITKENEDPAEFAFAHDTAYTTLEEQFFGLIHLYDPMRIVHFLRQHPYHVSSLIQVSKVAKQDQNSALAADLCERALYTMGRVSLSTFRKKLEEGKARLNFYRPENRQFWLAGYNYVKNLIMRGTFRTALEWTKLFLSISHEDPYDMMNWIHVLAIRAFEGQWFLDLCDTDLFSNAGKLNSTKNRHYIKQTAVLAKLQVKDKEGAMALLVAGMERLPWLYCSLFSALNLDTPKSIWGVQPQSDEDGLHTSLYIHIAKDLWNNPDAIALLKEAGNAAKKVDANSLPEPAEVSDSTARFVYLDNTPSLMEEVPQDMLHVSPNFDFDPLPPPMDENVFSNEWQKIPWLSESEHRGLDQDQQIQDLRQMIEIQAHNAPPGARRMLDALIQGLGGNIGFVGGAQDPDHGFDDHVLEESLHNTMPGGWPGDSDGEFEGDWMDEVDDMNEDDFDDDGDEDDDDLPDLIAPYDAEIGGEEDHHEGADHD